MKSRQNCCYDEQMTSTSYNYVFWIEVVIVMWASCANVLFKGSRLQFHYPATKTSCVLLEVAYHVCLSLQKFINILSVSNRGENSITQHNDMHVHVHVHVCVHRCQPSRNGRDSPGMLAFVPVVLSSRNCLGILDFLERCYYYSLNIWSIIHKIATLRYRFAELGVRYQPRNLFLFFLPHTICIIYTCIRSVIAAKRKMMSSHE